MAKRSGNGIVFCNIYGNKSYDFSQVKFICDSNDWCSYSLIVKTGDFPKTVPMNFRIWREPDGTGSIFVRKITVELLDDLKSDEMSKFISKETISKNVFSNSTEILVQKEKIGPVEISTINPSKIPSHSNQQNTIGKRESCKYSAGELHMFKTKTPKILPVSNEKIKVSVVISLYNRREILDRTLWFYSKQTLPKNEFELVIVDDKSSEDILGICKEYSSTCGLNFNYILVDKTKGIIPPKSFNQALTNNIGFKKSRGSVIVITGPETIQKETNLEKSWIMANEGYCVYGDIYRSSQSFIDEIKKGLWKTLSFSDLIKIPGAMQEKGQLGGFWWYYVAVRKEHLMNINGVDERYMNGITAEDDNFAFRMDLSGVPLIRNHNIIGIHQDHSREDKLDLHSVRDTNFWQELRNTNIRLFNNWFINHESCIANIDIDWGTDNAIIKQEIF